MQSSIEVALTRAQSYFKISEERDLTVRAQLARERTETDAKTARLRALRLAKEAQDLADHAGKAVGVAAP